MSDDVNINAYFERIGFAGSIAPNLQTLQALVAAHTIAIPFENLNPLLGLPVRLDLRSLEQKLIHDRRGGYCFEQNTLFMRALQTLGFEVEAHAARVLIGRPADGPVPSRNHMMLKVEIGGASYLADVGFGGMTPSAPLRLRADVEQETPHTTFRLTGEDPHLVLEAKSGEEWQRLYTFDTVPQHDADFDVFNWHVATHPDSFFANNLAASKFEKTRRFGLVNTAFSTHPNGGPIEKRTLTSVGEIRDILTGTFGIALPPQERLDPVLERLVAASGTP